MSLTAGRAIRRRPTLLELMLLVVATGGGLAGLRATAEGRWKTTLLHGPLTPFDGVWEGPWVVLFLSDLLTAVPLPLVGGWTFLLPILARRRGRPGWRRVMRGPGIAACLAAIAGLAMSLVPLAGALAAGLLVDGALRRPAASWAQVYVMEPLILQPGVAVAATWATLALTGRWRPSTDWIDRAGRLVGLAWAVGGLAWGARAYSHLL